jgi:MYXO-CTERM domain-containing protein
MTVDTSDSPDADLTLNMVESATVPAPAALPGGLALMGMLGLSRYRRRRQQVA